MMDCFCSKAPGDEELLKHVLDGEALPTVAKRHLAQCSTCQQRLFLFTTTNKFLLTKLYRSQCPGMMTLSHYCMGMLSADEVMNITSHLQVCPLCAEEVAVTRRELAMNEEEKPLFSLQASLQRIIASLVPWQPQLVTRGEKADALEQYWPRQYRADNINLSLHLSRDSHSDLLLLGLLSSINCDENIEAFEGLKVELYRIPLPIETHGNEDIDKVNSMIDTRGPLLSTRVDDLGNIVFKSVPVGSYLMIIYLPEMEMVIEGLNIEKS